MKILAFRNTRPASTTSTFDEKPQNTQLAETTAENSREQVTITTFHDVETPQVSIIPAIQSPTSLPHMDDTVSIVQFLQRPVKLYHSQLKFGDETIALRDIATSDPQPRIKSWSLPGDILKLGGKYAKVLNHQYFKADVHVKVVINTNPFVSGRFYLTYSPYEHQITPDRRLEYASRAGVTAYPGVEIDVQLDNTVEMVIPYASYKEAYVLTEDDEDYVVLYLLALTPVMGTTDGQGVVDLAVYAWFENIEINVPTLKEPAAYAKAQGQPQAAALSPKDLERLRSARKIEKLEKTNPSVYNYIMQMIGPKRVNASMQVQAEAKEPGPVESVAGVVGGIAEAVGGWGLPVVSEVAGAVKWISNIVGGISGIFGWSRPNSYTQITPFQNVPGKFYTHFEGDDQSVSLALSNTNELDKPENIFPSAVDEMSLAYVCANPAVKHIFKWKVSTNGMENVTTQPIGLVPVGIGSFTAHTIGANAYVVGGDSLCSPIDSKCSGLEGAQLYDPTAFTCVNNDPSKRYWAHLEPVGTINNFILDTAPCEYVSQLFRYWRATLCFKISVVKTAFHTGRLEIFFDPGMYQSLNDDYITPNLTYYSDTDTTNNYKYILDLTNDTEVTIKVPFVSERLFKNTRGLNSGARLPTIQDVSDSIIGSLVLRPVSNLLAPPNVAPEANVIVWKWAEDVVLGAPVTAANNDMQIYSKDRQVQPQLQKLREMDEDFVRSLPYLGRAQKLKEKQEGSKQKREVDFQINLGNKADANVVTFFSTTNIEGENMTACKNALGERIVNLRPLLRVFRPFKNEIMTEEGITYDIQRDRVGDQIDYISYLSYMYRFFRGGVRYKLFAKFGERTMLMSRVHSGPKPGTENTPSHITYTDLNPVHEVSVPFYCNYRKLPISVGDNILNVTFDGKEGDAYQYLTMRSGNDDLTFGWLMGTPQLQPGNTSVKWTGYQKGDEDPKVIDRGCVEAPCPAFQVNADMQILPDPDDINPVCLARNALSKVVMISRALQDCVHASIADIEHSIADCVSQLVRAGEQIDPEGTYKELSDLNAEILNLDSNTRRSLISLRQEVEDIRTKIPLPEGLQCPDPQQGRDLVDLLG